jgi:hypothetical protein
VPIPATSRNFSCTASIGVSRPCDAPEKFNAAWREADQALYAAKEAGRDRVRMVATLHEVQIDPPTQSFGPAASSRPLPFGNPATPVRSAAPAASSARPDVDPADQDTTPDGLLLNLPENTRAAD